MAGFQVTTEDLVETELQINHERFHPVDIKQVYIRYGTPAAVPH